MNDHVRFGRRFPGGPRAGSLRSRVAGLSLVELMVAVTVGLILVLGLIAFMATGRASYRAQGEQARVQESGRLGTEVLAFELRMAGYMGCPTLRRVQPRSVASPAPAAAFDADNIIAGFEAGLTDWTPALPADLSTALIGSDVIRTQRASSCAASLDSNMGNDTADIRVTTGHGCGFAAGDLLMVVDCDSADIFRASSVGAGAGVDVIAHGLAANTESRLGKAYGTDAQVFKIETTSFFIATGASGEPALWRLVDDGTPLELVEGVEDMEILYGEDTNNDLAADRYLPADDANLDMERVVSVRASLLVRSDDGVAVQPQTYRFDGATVTAGDRRSRRVFTATLNLRDRSS